MADVVKWHILGESVEGATHLRTKLGNQDAIKSAQSSEWWLMAVSDGHGSSTYFRSNLGSRFAVDIAIRVVKESGIMNYDLTQHAILEDIAKQQITKEIARRWNEAVDQDVRKEGYRSEELEGVDRKSNSWRRVEKNRGIVYGATLLTVLVTQTYIIYWQLGDGDILTFSSAGEVFLPLPPDERLFANETSSLCEENAWKNFRVRIHPLSGGLPSLIMLSTDGYSNSFADPNGFYEVGRDLLPSLNDDEGIKMIEKNLKTWLADASMKGSGDDITLGLIWREPAIGEIFSKFDVVMNQFGKYIDRQSLEQLKKGFKEEIEKQIKRQNKPIL